jgi:hypothetical protein
MSNIYIFILTSRLTTELASCKNPINIGMSLSSASLNSGPPDCANSPTALSTASVTSGRRAPVLRRSFTISVCVKGVLSHGHAPRCLFTFNIDCIYGLINVGDVRATCASSRAPSSSSRLTPP